MNKTQQIEELKDENKVLLWGFIIITVILLVVIWIGLPIIDKEGYNQGINDTLNNYSCGEKEPTYFNVELKEINDKGLFFNFNSCKEIRCPCMDYGCMAYCYICEK